METEKCYYCEFPNAKGFDICCRCGLWPDIDYSYPIGSPKRDIERRVSQGDKYIADLSVAQREYNRALNELTFLVSQAPRRPWLVNDKVSVFDRIKSMFKRIFTYGN